MRSAAKLAMAPALALALAAPVLPVAGQDGAPGRAAGPASAAVAAASATAASAIPAAAAAAAADSAAAAAVAAESAAASGSTAGAGAAPAPAGPAVLPAPAVLFGASLDERQLAGLRGGSDTPWSDMKLQGAVSGNSAAAVATGANLITEGAFSNASGLPMVIQNSGANVLIQNATIVNVQFR